MPSPQTRDNAAPATRFIHTPELFDGERLRGPSVVEIIRGRIAALHPPGHQVVGSVQVRLPDNAVLAPGFIDIQVNGGSGILLNDAPSPQTIRRIVAAHRPFGTTGLLPTLITDAPDKLRTLVACAAESIEIPGILGFHIEGPFLNIARKGIHPAEHIRKPSADELRLLSRLGGIGQSLVTLAPECVGEDTIRQLVASGLRVSIGHSEAAAVDVSAAIAAGATGVTHLFNAMSQMSPREPGVVGATLASGQLIAGVICDGFHVNPVNLKVAYRAMGHDRLMLITDAMALTGSAERDFNLHGRRIQLNGGRLTDENGTLAGAHLTMFDAMRNAMAMMEAPLESALIMASRTPASFLGLGATHGRIAPGFVADMVAFAPNHVIATWVSGISMSGPCP